MSAFARDSYFVPSPSYACFRDTSQRAPADGQECKLVMTLRDFVHYAEHNRDEEPLCVVHDLSVGPGHSRTFAPRNVPFFTGDLFDVLDKRPPKDFLCIEPIGGGAFTTLQTPWHGLLRGTQLRRGHLNVRCRRGMASVSVRPIGAGSFGGGVAAMELLPASLPPARCSIPLIGTTRTMKGVCVAWAHIC
jgi:hypothetical protein